MKRIESRIFFGAEVIVSVISETFQVGEGNFILSYRTELCDAKVGIPMSRQLVEKSGGNAPEGERHDFGIGRKLKSVVLER